MRFYEFAPKKHIKPLNPAQARIYSLQLQKERATKLLKAEKERQRRAEATQKIQQANKMLRKY